jgi:hypothetical protein
MKASFIAAIMLAAMSVYCADSRAQSESPPEFDMHEECVAQAKAIATSADMVRQCVSYDDMLRRQLSYKWSTIPESLKARCEVQITSAMRLADGAQTHYERLYECINGLSPVATRACDPAKPRDCAEARVDALFNQLNQAVAQTRKVQLLAEQALGMRYKQAINKAVMDQFVRPDNMPAVTCNVRIVQRPGGDVLSATVDPSCPDSDLAKRSIADAVLRAQPLPYKGYEPVFSPVIEIQFDPR